MQEVIDFVLVLPCAWEADARPGLCRRYEGTWFLLLAVLERAGGVSKRAAQHIAQVRAGDQAFSFGIHLLNTYNPLCKSENRIY